MVWPLPLGRFFSLDTSAMIVGLLPLLVLLLAAVRSDLRDHRIPNHLVLFGMVSGLLLHTILPDGNGFLAKGAGALGPWSSLQGLCLGAAAMFPFYCLRTMGAGDVKLMAAVGAILGPGDIVPALAGTLLAGGLVSLGVAVFAGSTGQLLRNLAAMAGAGLEKLALPGKSGIEPPARSAGAAPYAVAVALGTLGSLLWAAAR